ncbi:18302_t:CDS:1 [Acaulospora morrowiae]|uniref:18302_t:CDS:1 n=1 Tax=Acaulospora morrowiae TaxID=94023 RepID=A0A9N9NA10_9GLOM|nr:18302_t:CDS:1 [Acaulospora morrowiae]
MLLQPWLQSSKVFLFNKCVQYRSCAHGTRRFLSNTQSPNSHIGRRIIRYPYNVEIKHDLTPIRKPRVKADLNSTTLMVSGPLGTHSLPIKPYIKIKFIDSDMPYVSPEERKLEKLTSNDDDDLDFIDESDFDKKLSISIEDEQIKEQKAMWGTTRSLIANYITGVSEGYRVLLKFVGVGYRASLEEDPLSEENRKQLHLRVGYSHPVILDIPSGIECRLPSSTKIVLSGTDKQLVTMFASEIRKYRPPEPYNQKGIFINDETIKKKNSKKK